LKNKRLLPLDVLKYAFLITYALLIVVPLFFILISSLKDDQDIFMHPFALPQAWHFNYYKEVWVNYDLYKYFINSIYYTSVSVIATVSLCALGAYAIVRLKWRLKNVAFSYFLLGLMVPTHALVVPLYIMAVKLRVNDPRITIVMIMTATHITTSLFILCGYLKKMPLEMEEAAVIDGCSVGTIFFRIVTPIMQPAIATVAIFAFLSIWNDFFVGLIFIDNQKLWSIQLGMSMFKGSLAVSYSHLLVAISITIVPAIVLYAVMNRKIIAGLTAGAVKA
jgi:raffinose/stachyose/melibiose transport system permease protein